MLKKLLHDISEKFNLDIVILKHVEIKILKEINVI